MDRFNWTSYNPYYSHDPYSQAPQEGGQHTFQPETGQTSAGVSVSGAWASYPALGQPYQNPNLQAQIPPSPDWEFFLPPLQPIAMPELTLPQLEAGQMSGEVVANGASGSYPALGQSYLNPNLLAQIPSWPRSDWGTSQPTTLADISQNDVLVESSNPQPIVEKKRRKSSVQIKARFLAGLDNYAQGVKLKYCSSSLRFWDYISDNGNMVRRGIPLYDELTLAEKKQLTLAITARKEAKGAKDSAKKRFLAGLNNYAQGLPLKYCSAIIPFKSYVSADGRLHDWGKDLYASLSPEEQQQVNQALRSRNKFYRENLADNDRVREGFLAGLDKYAQGLPLKDCSATLDFARYASAEGNLSQRGQYLFDSLPKQDQARVYQALLSRCEKSSTGLMANASVEERFLAGLDKYAQGLLLKDCSASFDFACYASDDGHLHLRGRKLRATLSPEDQRRVDQALIDRRRIASELLSGDVDQFVTALGPYGNGLALSQCETSSSLTKKVFKYLTEEGGLTPRGELLIENLQPDQQIGVWYAIEKRRQILNSSTYVPGSPWQLPEMPSSMPEQGGMNPTAMIDPIQTETMYNPMQTETMWATAWQLTGQAVPGIWGIPSESAEPSIPHYSSEAVGANFLHQYGPHGLIPQRASDRLIGRGIEDGMLINIQGEEYRVREINDPSVRATNENPYGKSFMLMPRMRGG
jgi:hypothetical protein